MSHNPLLGNRISLISKRDIRYEGTLYSINETDATVALQNVRTYGTEGREERSDPPGTFVPPMSEIHSCLVFRGCDIKDLHVHDAPARESLPDDPAIVSSEAPPPPQPQSRAEDKQSDQSAKEDGNGQSGGVEGAGNNGKTASAKPQDASAPPSTNGVDSDGKQRQQQPRQPGGANKDPSRVNGSGGGTKQQQKGGAGDGSSNGQKSTNRNSNNNRRTRKSDMQVGTGASLLRRKERGVVGGAEDPTTGEFDFESSTAGFQKEQHDAAGGSAAAAGNAAEDDVGGVNVNGGDTEGAYSKDDFFDSISCDAIDRRDGVDNRLRGAAERSLNTETFGAASLGTNRRGGRRYRHRGSGGGGGGGGRRGGGRGRGGGGGGGGGDHDRSGGGGGPAPRQNRRWRRGPNYSNREHNGSFNSAPRTAKAGGEG